MNLNNTKWVEVGNFAIDSGMFWIGDPAYLIKRSGQKREIDESPDTKNWNTFLEALDSRMISARFKLGHEGLGVVLPTGVGDGMFTVEALENKDGRWEEIRIRLSI